LRLGEGRQRAVAGRRGVSEVSGERLVRGDAALRVLQGPGWVCDRRRAERAGLHADDRVQAQGRRADTGRVSPRLLEWGRRLLHQRHVRVEEESAGADGRLDLRVQLEDAVVSSTSLHWRWGPTPSAN